MFRQTLVDHGVKEENITFFNVVSCPEGLQALEEVFPNVVVITAAIDNGLNHEKYIVPGLGDYGERYFNTM